MCHLQIACDRKNCRFFHANACPKGGSCSDPQCNLIHPAPCSAMELCPNKELCPYSHIRRWEWSVEASRKGKKKPGKRQRARVSQTQPQSKAQQSPTLSGHGTDRSVRGGGMPQTVTDTTGVIGTILGEDPLDLD